MLFQQELSYVFCRPGSDLLSRALRQSTIGAEAVNDRVRNGIGWGHLAITTRPAKNRRHNWNFQNVTIR